jgi:hypothetical protein
MNPGSQRSQQKQQTTPDSFLGSGESKPLFSEDGGAGFVSGVHGGFDDVVGQNPIRGRDPSSPLDPFSDLEPNPSSGVPPNSGSGFKLGT